MTKLFISYRSLDSVKVDSIVARLRNFKSDDGSQRFTVWQDKISIPAGQDWWNSIVNAIGDCHIFVFMVSHESVQNPHCRAELSYARRRNRPVIPVVLDGEFFYSAEKDKYDVSFWADIPADLVEMRSQFLFCQGGGVIQQFEEAIAAFESDPEGWQDIVAPVPLDPRSDAENTSSDTGLYNQACDYAWRLEYLTAERLFDKLLHLPQSRFRMEAKQWIEILRQYQELSNSETSNYTYFQFISQWPEYEKQFPKPFTQLFDPRGFKKKLIHTLVEPDTPELTGAVVNSMTAYDYVERGNKYASIGDYDRAIVDFSDAIRLNRDDGDFWYLRGLAREHKGEYQEAISDFSRAIRREQDFEEAYQHRGACRVKLGKYGDATEDFDEAIRLNPNNSLAYYYKGRIHRLFLRLDLAKADILEAIRLGPKHAEAYFELGLIRVFENNSEGALSALNEALRLNPRHGDAYCCRGHLRHGGGDYDGAIADYTAAISFQLNDFHPAQAYCYRGNCHREKGEFEEAYADYDEAIRQQPQDSTAYRERGLAHAQRMQYNQALIDYTEAIALDTKDSGAYYLRGLVRSAINDNYGAFDDFEMAVRISPYYALAQSALDSVRGKVKGKQE